MRKLIVGAVGLGLAGAAVGMYLSMPDKNQRQVRRGLQDTADDLREVMDGFTER